MTIAHIEGLGYFEIDWRTTIHPTHDTWDEPGDPWEFEIDTVWWLSDNEAWHKWTGIRVTVAAQWHRMPDGRCLSEHLEDWIWKHEEPEEPDMYDDFDLDF